MSSIRGDRCPESVTGSAFTLPCSRRVVKNRLVKAAMTEGLADPATNLPNDKHVRLYERWARGGAAVLITGNFMIDARHLEGPRNVVVDRTTLNSECKAVLSKWSAAIKAHSCLGVVQLSHPGRQSPISCTWQPLCPSKSPLTGMVLPVFGSPKEMSQEEIRDVVERFAFAARACEEAGFDGVQVHSAHGYLLSQFLSPHVNRRTDEYAAGGARVLEEVLRAVRGAVGPRFVVGLKINSADFLRGGLTEDQSLAVIRKLDAGNLGLDFIEISGGTYNNAKMMEDPKQRGPSQQREAHFTQFAQRVRGLDGFATPLMLTGGFRSLPQMDRALADGVCDLVGVARPLCVEPECPSALLDGSIEATARYTIDVDLFNWSLRSKTLNAALQNTWHGAQIGRLGNGQDPDMGISRIWLLLEKPITYYTYDPWRNPRKTWLLCLTCVSCILATAWYRSRGTCTMSEFT